MLVHPGTRQALKVDKPVGWGHIQYNRWAAALDICSAHRKGTQMNERCQYRDCAGVTHGKKYCAIHQSAIVRQERESHRRALLQEYMEEAKRLNMSMADLEERIYMNQPILPLVGRTKRNSQGYILVRVKRGKKGWRLQHIVIAEKALGKKLPEGAIVHHVDENPANNENSNLVVCQDHSYHRILHGRTNRLNKYGKADKPLKTGFYIADFSDL